MSRKNTVSIEFFGNQRIIAGIDRVSMPVTEKTVASDALEYIQSMYPDLPLDEEIILVTVNQEVVPSNRLLRANDTVCFIPFIGGG